MRSFFDKLRYKFSVFMNGRYGTDGFNNFLLYVALALMAINIIFRSYILSTLELLIVIYSFFRMFSKNSVARRRENQKYYKVKQNVVGFFTLIRDMIRDRKTHIFKKCPSCRAVLRFPKKPGDHTATCPKCGHRFDVHVK